MGQMLYTVIDFLFKGVRTLILIRIILSWVMPRRTEFSDTIYALTEPILAPLRVMVPIGNMRLDLAPIVAFYLIGLLRNVILRLLF